MNGDGKVVNAGCGRVVGLGSSSSAFGALSNQQLPSATYHIDCSELYKQSGIFEIVLSSSAALPTKLYGVVHAVEW